MVSDVDRDRNGNGKELHLRLGLHEIEVGKDLEKFLQETTLLVWQLEVEVDVELAGFGGWHCDEDHFENDDDQDEEDGSLIGAERHSERVMT